ncbi:MAG TPA: M14 metallopeptidase family protein [Longimicrobiaceae bacterium]|nr:M14 metallopeptidase family protein [Longimicrobiaceae bacterium]
MTHRAAAARLALLAGLVLLAAPALPAQGVPTPAAHFGFQPGAHRRLAGWTELLGYYEAVARASPRVKLDTLGTTTLGRPFVMLTVTSPENHARLPELRDVQLRLSDPRRIGGPAELEALLDRGKTVVLITQHIHSTEVGAGQMAPNLLHRLAASDDARVREILDNVILLHVPSLNPDGTEMVADWYRRWVGTPFEAAPLPALYHHYVGHDNNRDWYAFTQKETQLTVEKAHNAWHPQIVHDVHQMGSTGARIFIPPYVDPVEPNVDPLIVAALNQLGTYMAAELISDGKTGVAVNAQYDMYTPARAYQHYHGGVRILTETASARMATPITIKPEELRSARGFDVRQRSWNFPAPWPGGEWGLPQIVDYQESAAMALLVNAARNRRFWLENFHAINRRAVERWPEWPHAWVIPAGQDNPKGVNAVLRILRMGDVEVHRAEAAFTAGGRAFPAGSWVVPMSQPYASFAQTMLERQDYPKMHDYPGGPPTRPYDVTAHTLPLLMDVEAVPVREPVAVGLSAVIPTPALRYETPAGLRGRGAPRIGIYKSWAEPMPEGWTRWTLDRHGVAYDTLHDADVRRGGLARRYDVILLQDQPARSIRNGYSAETMPEPYAGGLGEEGARALQEFVRDGGRLVAVEEATDFAIEALDLPVKNAVAGLRPQDFYIPGSILRLRLDGGHPLARGADAETIAWYWGSSRAFQVEDPSVRVVARYGEGNPLLSGWILGEQHVAGKPALLEARVGRGSVVLFGFQPDYRGQSIATWPLLFNALRRAR